MTSTGSPSPTGSSLHWPTNSYLLAATFGLIYFLAVYAGLLFVTHPEGLSLIWPASGVALATLLLRPRREWPVILGIIFIVNLTSNIVASGTAPLVGAGFALANTLEPALGGWLMTRWLGEQVSFTRLTEVVGLVLAATLANALTAGLGALIPVWAFGAVYANTWLTWWVLDGLSLLTITPFLVTPMRDAQRFTQRTWRRWIEAGAWLGLLCLGTWFIFGESSVDIYIEPHPYMLLPILVLIAFRFSPSFSALTLMIISFIALTTQPLGGGPVPLGGDSPRERLIAVQAFWSVASIMILTLAAAVSERQRTERALRESEQLYRTLFETVPMQIFTKDRAGRYTSSNAENRKYWAVDIVGRTDLELVGAEAARPARLRDQQIIETGAELTYEQTVVSDHFGTRTLLTRKAPLHDASGEIIGLLAASMDITERKQMEEAVRESEASLRESQQVAHVGHWVWDTHQNTVVWSDEMKRIFGLDPETFDGDLTQIIAQAIHPDDREKVNASNQILLTEGKSAPLEYRVVWADQSIRTVLAIPGNAVLNEAGEVIKLTGIVQDITEHKQAEQERQNALTLMTNVINATPDLIFVKDPELRTILCNEAFAQALGQPASALYGRTDEENGWDPELVRGNPAKGIRGFRTDDLEALAGQEIVNPNDPANVRGVIRFFDTRKFPLRDASGQIIGVIGVSRDVTERKQAEDKIKTALAEKETLLRELYHRTKNNMQVISALLDLQAAEIGDERLQIAFRDTQNRIHAMALVHEKLYQARDLSQVNLKSYIEDLARLLFSTYPVTANQIKLVTELDEVLVTIDTAIPCGLILNELISNALKYAFPAGRAGQIHIRLRELPPARSGWLPASTTC